MGAIAGLIMIALVAWMLFSPSPKPPARCLLCNQLLPPQPKKKSDIGSIIFLIALIILLAWGQWK